MATHMQNPTIAHQLGRWAEHVWRRLIWREKQVARWLHAKGLPVPLANALPWTALFVIFGAAFYVAAITALLILAVVVFAMVISHVDVDDVTAEMTKPQWRDGLDGYGLYKNGARIDSSRIFEDE